MKKLLLLSALLIFACSSDDNNNELLNCDGAPYQSIIYGSQEWTVENACHTTYRDGTLIPEVTDATEWESLTTGAWSYYDNDPTKPRLYNWYAVMGVHDAASSSDVSLRKEFAPEGWHVPLEAEWTTLVEYLIANGFNYDGTTTVNKIAKAIASNSGWNSATNTGAVGNDQSINNSSGFNAFPEGMRSNLGPFVHKGEYALFWCSRLTVQDGGWVPYRYIHRYSSQMPDSTTKPRNGFSVRLVRD